MYNRIAIIGYHVYKMYNSTTRIYYCSCNSYQCITIIYDRFYNAYNRTAIIGYSISKMYNRTTIIYY